MSRIKEDDGTKWILAGLFIGILMGIGLAVCIIDDLESFRIPLTNKVFQRVYFQGEQND